MAEQVALAELRFPPEVEAAVQKAVAAVGVTATGAADKVVEAAAKKETSAAPKSPFIMFINGKSGGRLGPDLLRISSELLTPAQARHNQPPCAPCGPCAPFGPCAPPAAASLPSALSTVFCRAAARSSC